MRTLILAGQWLTLFWKLDIDQAVELGVERVELEGMIQELEKQR